MKSILTYLFFLIPAIAFTQTGISSYTIVNAVPTPADNAATGWPTANPPFSSSTTYGIHYGKVDAATNGEQRVITMMQIAGGPSAGDYVPVAFSGARPFDTIVVQRRDNARVMGRRINALYEFGSLNGATNDLYLQPEYNESMEDLLNHKHLNVGSDNTFVNDASTENNIERLDLIFKTGVTAVTADLARVGVLINERGGNDFFKAAAIFSVDANSQATALGPLVQVTPGDWGNVGPSINTIVMSKEETDPFLQPKEELGSQQISGVFISLLDLGITTGGTYIHGLALFPNDVNAGMDLLGLTDVPLNTAGGAVGGLDVMAGCGIYRETGTLVILPINFRSFTAKKINDAAALLNWTVANDNNKSGLFKVERSSDGVNFSEMAVVHIQTQATADYVYSFMDENPATGQNFYRIKSIDAAGKTEYSKVLAVMFSIVKPQVNIGWSPGSNQAWINTLDISGLFVVRIFDTNGSLLQMQRISCGANATTAINLAAINSPAFVIQVTQANKTLVTQTVVR